jgi:zinc transporter, ZIP family
MHVSGLVAAFWGLVAGSAFVFGGIAGLRVRISDAALGLLIALGAGSLLAAVAYELVDEAGRLAGGTGLAGLGLIAGSFLYLLATGYWDSTDAKVDVSFRSLVVTVVPEAVIIVGSLLSGHHIGAATIAAVFLCGVPDAFAVTAHLTAAGLAPRTVLLVWSAMAIVCGLSAGVAYVLLDRAAEPTVAVVLACAGGAVLTGLTTELIPDARSLAGPLAGPIVVVGFGLVFGLIEVA